MSGIISSRITTIPAKGVRSLVWEDNRLVDWAMGGIRYQLDGKVVPRPVFYPYRFDASCVSPSGEYEVLYERLGTKGLVLQQGEILREIDRSYYHAEVYEFPVTIARLPTGREVLIHCPKEYNQLEVDDVATGERITKGERKPFDFFHSRLATSGGMLLSAGWIWHPVDSLCVYDIQAAIENPTALDGFGLFDPPSPTTEISSAAFLDERRVVLATSSESFADEEDFARSEFLRPNMLAVCDLAEHRMISQVGTTETVGTIMPLGHRFVAGFYEQPKVFDLQTGQVVWRLPELSTGKQASSIINHLEPLPPLALDARNRRFAVAGKDEIHVVELNETVS